MKLVVIGIGDCGSNIAVEFVRLAARAKSETGVEILVRSYAINDDKARLEVLRRAGVVDAGALGFYGFIQGIAEYLVTGRRAVMSQPRAQELDERHEEPVGAGEITFRYCTEAILKAELIDADRLRRELQGFGDSLIVAGGEGKVRIHIHTDTPAARLVPVRPLHLVNAALNLTQGDNLAWQERKAASFSFTPMYCGYEIQDPDGRVISGYQHTNDYVRNEGKWISLGLPISVSGAAASPNEGYHSSAATAFLMTVFNVRLGWWLQNPRYAQRWQRPGPRFSLFLLLQELAGMTDDESHYVYLSDGGHFENLGVYELVRRRCRYIIACDAGCDPKYGFEDLGNVIRKCQIDLGIGIDIDQHHAFVGVVEQHPALAQNVVEAQAIRGRCAAVFVLDAGVVGRIDV